jgi:hypothetical protein
MNKLKIFSWTSLTIFLNIVGLSAIFASTENSLQITEIGNFETSEYEWIEVQNTSNQDIVLTDLIFREDNINHKTSISQGTNILKPDQFLLIVNNYSKFILKYPELNNPENIILDSSWSSLSNSGENLELYSNSLLISQVSYPENLTTNSIQFNLGTQSWTNTDAPTFFSSIVVAQTDTNNPPDEVIEYLEPIENPNPEEDLADEIESE